MTHNDLVNDVTKQLSGRFQPNPLDIKRRIESLIEVGINDIICKLLPCLTATFIQREFLERYVDKRSYNYLVSVTFCKGLLTTKLACRHK